MAAHAAIDTCPVLMGKFAAVGPFGAAFTRDIELRTGQ